MIVNATRNVGKIGHFHAAGNPGRHELFRGELDYQQIFAAINQTGFEGYVGLEYWPVQQPDDGLKAVAQWFRDAT